MAVREEERGSGVQIRGRWVSTPTRRQDSGSDIASFDGSQGVDSEDILGIPQIGYSSFQLFPDQNQYEPADSTMTAYNSSVNAGINWITKHAQVAHQYVVLIGFSTKRLIA